MDRIRPAGEIPPEADWGDPDEQEPWGKTHAKGFTYPSGVTADDIDNWQTLEAERETSDETISEEPFNVPCPDAVWIGPFAAAGEALQLRSWPIWATLYALFSAHAGRRLTLTHYLTHYHAMSYVAVVGPTGRGKRIVPVVARVGAPEYFHAGLTAQLNFGPPNSAPALGYMIAHYERDQKPAR